MTPLLPKSLHVAFLAGVALVTGGCTTTYRFKVDAIKNQDASEEARSYRVVSANPEMSEEDLRFKEAAEYVKTAMSSKGMYEAPRGTEADMTVEVDFGISEPRTEYHTIQEPIYVETGGGTRVVMVAVRDPKTGQTIMVPQTIFDPPRRQLVGFQDRVVAVTVYEKYLRITARESQDEAGDRPPRELWSVYVSNEDESGDLREYVPLMVSAAMDEMNQNSTSQKEVVLKKDDERVTFVTKGVEM